MMVFDLGVTRRLRSTGPDYEITLGISRAFALPGYCPGGQHHVLAPPALHGRSHAVRPRRSGQRSDQRDEQFYYPGSFNWTFLKIYPEAARLFNAFDYGHAVLYERLLTKPAAEREAALEKEYQFLTTDLLVQPPRFAIAEEVIEPAYAKLAWQAKQMFDWAHLLHRQIYDIYSDERLDDTSKNSADREGDRLLPQPEGYRVHRRAQVHGAHGRSVLQPGLPEAPREVQRPDLVVSLAAGRALRAADSGQDRDRAKVRRQGDAGPVLVDAAGSALALPEDDADDGDDRADLHGPASRGRRSSSTTCT